MSRLSVTIDGVAFDIQLKPRQPPADDLTVVVNGQELRVTVPELNAPEQSTWMVIDGRPCEIAVDHHLRWIRSSRGIHHLEIHDLETPVTRPTSGDGRVKAPIPGVIARVLVEAGEHVEAGQPLLVLEAMKMENQILAPRTGTVGQVLVATGQNVAFNTMLTEIE